MSASSIFDPFNLAFGWNEFGKVPYVLASTGTILRTHKWHTAVDTFIWTNKK